MGAGIHRASNSPAQEMARIIKNCLMYFIFSFASFLKFLYTLCSRAYMLKISTPWLPPGGICQTALRNRLTDEGRRTVGQEMQLDEMRGVCSRLYHSTEKSKTFSCRCPSSVMVNNRFRSADYLPCQLFNFGMVATGNHHFERFAALCNTLGGSQETHRRWLFINY